MPGSAGGPGGRSGGPVASWHLLSAGPPHLLLQALEPDPSIIRKLHQVVVELGRVVDLAHPVALVR